MKDTIQSAIEFNNGISEKIYEICNKPLFERFEEFGLKSFGYVKLFRDGKWLCVSNNTEWVSHFFSEAYKSTEFQKNILNEINQGSEFLTYCNSENDLKIPIYAAALSKNIWYGLNIYNRSNSDSVEYCYFHGSPESHSLLNFYINNIDLLKHFFLYFKEQAKDIIDINNKKKIVLLKKSLFETNSNEIMDKKRAHFFQEALIERLFVKSRSGSVRLSKRETECLVFLKEGKKVKEIARNFHISPRTVEQYINNIKIKANERNIHNIILS